MNNENESPMKSTQTHTPGPWHVEIRSSGHRYNGEPVQYFSVAHTSATRDGYVALDVAPVSLITSIGDVPNAEGEANARLIAAAPDLISALCAIVNGPVRMSHMKNDQLSEHDPKVIAARAAIARATAQP